MGDTPARQLGPAISHMNQRFKLKKWALTGNDYIWPRMSHAHAKIRLRREHLDIVSETYLPFSSNRVAQTVEQIASMGADAVLISLVGRDAVAFNRMFGAMGLHSRVFRLSCAIEENGLLASGIQNLDRLSASASSFGALDTPENAKFRERYHSPRRDRAPVLNAMWQSIYEGMQFLSSLVNQPDQVWRAGRSGSSRPISYKSARRGHNISNAQTDSPDLSGACERVCVW